MSLSQCCYICIFASNFFLISHFVQPWGPLLRPLVIGHRGGAPAYVPEHSVPSYLTGIKMGELHDLRLKEASF